MGVERGHRYQQYQNKETSLTPQKIPIKISAKCWSTCSTTTPADCDCAKCAFWTPSNEYDMSSLPMPNSNKDRFGTKCYGMGFGSCFMYTVLALVLRSML